MKVGAEPKKVAILAGLLVLAAISYVVNSGDDIPPQSAGPRPQAVRPTTARPQQASAQPAAPVRRVARSASNSNQEFRPSLRPRDPSERPDPATIDPTLRLDVLAKLNQVSVEGGRRNLFEFSTPPPKAPDPKAVLAAAVKPASAKAPEAPKTPVAPVKPPPPPIPLKFYGYTNPIKQGVKRAFFLDGEDIVVATEGDLIKRRYKVIKIGLSSVVVEDIEHKHQQTLPLVPDQIG
jgi:hypothetical protein